MAPGMQRYALLLLCAVLGLADALAITPRATIHPRQNSEIILRTGIAAVNAGTTIRVYTQDSNGGIRESQYAGSWTGGTEDNVIATAQVGSPIAVAAQGSEEFKRNRVYYISTDGKLKERGYDGASWFDGGLNGQFEIAANSKLASCFFAASDDSYVRVYAQLADGSIQEFGFNGEGTQWQVMMNLGLALPGTGIACASPLRTSGLSMRVYFQTPTLDIVEKSYDTGMGWYDGDLSVSDAAEGASLAAQAFGPDPTTGTSVRLYYSAAENQLQEMAFGEDYGWVQGEFDQASIPGSNVAMVTWGSSSEDRNHRVYFQRGAHGSGVSEWAYSRESGAWTPGAEAIPPA